MKHDKMNKCFWDSASIDNKSAVIAFYEYYPDIKDAEKGIVRTFYIGFGIGNNRKQVYDWMINGKNFLDNKITGTGSIKFLIWAKNKLLEFEKYIKDKYPNGKIKIVVDALDKRRFSAYKKSLFKYGYKPKTEWSEELIKVI